MPERDANQLAADVRAGFLTGSFDGLTGDQQATAQRGYEALDELVALVGTHELRALELERRLIGAKMVEEALRRQVGTLQNELGKESERCEIAEGLVGTLQQALDAARSAHDLKVAVNRNAIEKWTAAEAALADLPEGRTILNVPPGFCVCEERCDELRQVEAALATTRQALAETVAALEKRSLIDYEHGKWRTAAIPESAATELLDAARRALADTGGDTA